MKKILMLLTTLLLVVNPLPAFAEDSKYELYKSAYSHMEYEDFLNLYDSYVKVYGEQTVPDDYENDDNVATVDNLSDIKTGYYHYFSKSWWIARKGEISLSIYWKDYLFEGSNNVVMYKAGKAWTALKNKHINDNNWNNTASMEAQFHCHVQWAGKNKNPYNIEPWRTESNLAKVIACRCNP